MYQNSDSSAWAEQNWLCGTAKSALILSPEDLEKRSLSIETILKSHLKATEVPTSAFLVAGAAADLTPALREVIDVALAEDKNWDVTICWRISPAETMGKL